MHIKGGGEGGVWKKFEGKRKVMLSMGEGCNPDIFFHVLIFRLPYKLFISFSVPQSLENIVFCLFQTFVSEYMLMNYILW